MKKIIIIILIICTMFSLSACDKEEEEECVDFITILDGILYIALEGNYTTGYTWITSIENEKIVKMNNEKYTPYESNGMVGVGGVYRAEFSGESDGNAKITFSYMRTFEDSLPVEKHIVKVVVENGKIISAEEIK